MIIVRIFDKSGMAFEMLCTTWSQPLFEQPGLLLQKNIAVFSTALAGKQKLVDELLKIATVYCTSSSEQVLAKVIESRIDIVLFEINDRTTNRIELFSKIKTIQPNIKMLVLNGLEDRDLIASAIARGACDVFHQPYRIDLIVERIRNLWRLGGK